MTLDVAACIRTPKIDVHTHVWPLGSPDEAGRSADHLADCARRLGIREVWACAPVTGGRWAEPDEIRHCNDAILLAMARRPDVIRGLCFVIPGHYKAATAEIERCLDAGMIGIKLYNQYKITDPAVRPVIELATERRVPILEHAAYLPAPEHASQQPLTSHGADFAKVSERYPEAILINAHIGGGGDWEWTIRALSDASPNVYVDTSGSNLDDGQVEFAVAELGAKRVLFGTDGTMEGGVGKILDADLSAAEKEQIYWGNAERILAAQGKAPLHPRADGDERGNSEPGGRSAQ